VALEMLLEMPDRRPFCPLDLELACAALAELAFLSLFLDMGLPFFI